MHEIVMKTIDKVSFKINIPVLVSIVVGVCTVYGSYVGILNEIKQTNVLFAEKISQQKEDINLITSTLKEHGSDIQTIKEKIAVLEWKK